jgi:hypothetical protein
LDRTFAGFLKNVQVQISVFGFQGSFVAKFLHQIIVETINLPIQNDESNVMARCGCTSMMFDPTSRSVALAM